LINKQTQLAKMTRQSFTTTREVNESHYTFSAITKKA